MSERGKSAKTFNDGANDKPSAVALYRKYRPRSLDEVIGQPQVTDILKAAAEHNNFAQSYLLTGQRGTGKTSVARILAHLINKTPYDPNSSNDDIDIIEIDAASHGSVDDARELREKSALAPLKSPYKIYIIDEVHMLSRQAFDALLKLIEEPPTHLRFILATTETQKVPATILSRVQRFHFRPVTPDIVAKHLREIADKEEIEINDNALLLIAERGGGSFRDAITLLDQLSSSNGKITRDTVAEIFGLPPDKALTEIISSIEKHDATSLISSLTNLFHDGINANILAESLIAQLCKIAPEKPEFYYLIEKLLEVTKSTAPEIKLTAILMENTGDNSIRSISDKPAANPASKTMATLATPTKSEVKLAQIIEKNIAQEKAHSTSYEGNNKHEDPSSDRLMTTQNVGAESTREKNDAFPPEINFEQLCNAVKDLDEPAALATLKLADFSYDGSVLKLYFAKSFHRRKAETANFREIVTKAAQKLYDSSPGIVIAKSAVREDSDAAKILDIMGGGEVVKHGKE